MGSEDEEFVPPSTITTVSGEMSGESEQQTSRIPAHHNLEGEDRQHIVTMTDTAACDEEEGGTQSVPSAVAPSDETTSIANEIDEPQQQSPTDGFNSSSSSSSSNRSNKNSGSIQG